MPELGLKIVRIRLWPQFDDLGLDLLLLLGALALFIAEAIVQPPIAPLPKLDHRRAQDVAAPLRRARDRTVADLRLLLQIS